MRGTTAGHLSSTRPESEVAGTVNRGLGQRANRRISAAKEFAANSESNVAEQLSSLR